MTVHHILADDDLTPAQQQDVLNLALTMKAAPFEHKPLAGPQSVAVLFDKTSTRTRFSFDAGIAQLGGNAIVVDSGKSQMGKKESFQDTGAVLSRFVSAIVWRTGAHSNLQQMAETAEVPIINGLCDDFHPCQILADLLTIVEHCTEHQDPAELKGLKAVYVGDGANNMANSYLVGFATAGIDITIAAPEGFQPAAEIVARAQKRAADTGATITITDDPQSAVDNADVVITDTWISMGMENDGIDRPAIFAPYQVDAALMGRANPTAVFLHCLPAYRGSEVAAEVIDGPQSKVFDEAENRLHAQKALLTWVLEHSDPHRFIGRGKAPQ